MRSLSDRLKILEKKSCCSKIYFYESFSGFPNMGRQNVLYIDKEGDGAYIWDGEKYTRAIDGSNINFLDLEDTPDSYSGHGGDLIVVNSIEDSVEFINIGDLGIGSAAFEDKEDFIQNGDTQTYPKISKIITISPTEYYNIDYFEEGVIYVIPENSVGILGLGGGSVKIWGEEEFRPFILKIDAHDSFFTIPTTGSGYSYDVDWGDGSKSYGHVGQAQHNYDDPGEYEVKIYGNFPRIYFNNSGDKDKVIDLIQWGDIEWKSFLNAFTGCINMAGSATDSHKANTRSVTSMAEMFMYCNNFNGEVNFDTSSVTQFRRMFRGATSFNQSVSSFDTSNVESGTFGFYGMFEGATSFNQSVSNFDTSNATQLSRMFEGATSFNQSVSSFDTSNVTDIGDMFFGASSFNQDISHFNLNNVSGTTWRSFNETTSLENVDVSNWGLKLIGNCSQLFAGTPGPITGLGNLNVEEVTSLSLAFNSANIPDYDEVLCSWSQQEIQNSVTVNFGSNKYTENAETCRDRLINEFGWTIIDGGKE